MKSKFTLGMTIGAVAGGLVTLFDHSTRMHVGQSLMKAGGEAKFYLQNPSVFVQEVQTAYAKAATSISASADKSLNGLNNVQQALEKVSHMDDNLQLEAPKKTQQLTGANA